MRNRIEAPTSIVPLRSEPRLLYFDAVLVLPEGPVLLVRFSWTRNSLHRLAIKGPVRVIGVERDSDQTSMGREVTPRLAIIERKSPQSYLVGYGNSATRHLAEIQASL